MNITKLFGEEYESSIVLIIVIILGIVICAAWIKLMEDIIITKDGYIVKTNIVPIRSTNDITRRHVQSHGEK